MAVSRIFEIKKKWKKAGLSKDVVESVTIHWRNLVSIVIMELFEISF